MRGELAGFSYAGQCTKAWFEQKPVAIDSLGLKSFLAEIHTIGYIGGAFTLKRIYVPRRWLKSRSHVSPNDCLDNLRLLLPDAIFLCHSKWETLH